MQSTKYPHLQSFLSGWFHQDFDIVGNSIEAIVDEFKQVSPAADAHAVAKDIRVFISAFEGQVDNEFGRDFEIDVDPREFAPSVEAFLEQIATRLETK